MTPPRLLVSVRDLPEAQAAVQGGCDLLDLKDPTRGPLGCPTTQVIDDVLAWLATLPAVSRPPLSLALGDFVDWINGTPLDRIPAGVQFLKLGTAPAPTHDPRPPRPLSLADYAAAWDRIWVRCDRDNPPVGIAVAYADTQPIGAPTPHTVSDWAAAIALTGWLLDTHAKHSGGLPTCLTADALRELTAYVRADGLTIGLAGRLTANDLPFVLGAAPDVIGIRSAACRDGDRSHPIDSERVCHFKHQLAHHAAAISQTAP